MELMKNMSYQHKKCNAAQKHKKLFVKKIFVLMKPQNNYQ